MRAEGFQNDHCDACLPPSARIALAGVSANTASHLRLALLASPGVRAVAYSAAIEDFQSPTGAILTAFRQVQNALALEICATRSFHDGRADTADGATFRSYGRQPALGGRLLSRAEPGTCRRRAVVARLKEEAMKWWLLLQEEHARTAGLEGLGPGEGHDTWSELCRVIREEPFVSWAAKHTAAEKVSSGAVEGDACSPFRQGILDEDGFQCPEQGFPAVAAHGVRLDLSDFAFRASVAMLSIFNIFFPPITTGGSCWRNGGRPSHSHLTARRLQADYCNRLASDWCFAASHICVSLSGSLLLRKGQRVIARAPPTAVLRGVGTVEMDDTGRMFVHWDSSARRVAVDRADSRDFALGKEADARSRSSDLRREMVEVENLDLCLAPIRTAVLEDLHQFVMGDHPGDVSQSVDGGIISKDKSMRFVTENFNTNGSAGRKCNVAPLIYLLTGPPGAGRSVCIARYLQQWCSGLSARAGLKSPSDASFGLTDRDHGPETHWPLVAFYLHGGDADQDEAFAEALCYLSNDINLQIQSLTRAGDNESDITLGGVYWEKESDHSSAPNSFGSSSVHIQKRLGAARRRFVSAVVRAVTRMRTSTSEGGRSVVVFVDGLQTEHVAEFVLLVQRLENDVLAGLRQVAPSRAANAALRAVLTCSRPPSPKDLRLVDNTQPRCRVVELGPLSTAELEAVVRHWIFRHSGLENPPQALVRTITEKSTVTSSPLYISALCHTAATLFNSSVGNGQTGNVEMNSGFEYEEQLNEEPDGLVQLFELGLLPKLEARHGRSVVSEVYALLYSKFIKLA